MSASIENLKSFGMFALSFPHYVRPRPTPRLDSVAWTSIALTRGTYDAYSSGLASSPVTRESVCCKRRPTPPHLGHHPLTRVTRTDPFAEADEDTGEIKQSNQSSYIHIRIQRTL